MSGIKREMTPSDTNGGVFSSLTNSLEAPFSFELPRCSLWRALRDERRPIFLYGTGNGADKILAELARFGVSLSGVFASPGFEREREFAGFHVESYDSVRERFGDDIVVLLAFGTTRDEVREFIELLDSRHTLYIPDVPLYGGELFEEEYLERHIEEIAAARALFKDEASLLCFDALIMFRLTGEYKYLLCTEETKKTLRTLFNGRSIRSIVDLGAYKGDSAAVFAAAFDSANEIIAVEPDPKTFLKLKAFAETMKNPSVVPLNFAAWDSEAELTFSGSSSRGAGTAGQNRRAKERRVTARRLDSLCLKSVDLIKYDVEGDERRAIVGSTETIKRCAPSLSVSLYHRTEDFFVLPLMLKGMVPNASFYLRRPPCIPFWDVNLYAVTDQ